VSVLILLVICLDTVTAISICKIIPDLPFCMGTSSTPSDTSGSGLCKTMPFLPGCPAESNSNGSISGASTGSSGEEPVPLICRLFPNSFGCSSS
jgi:hypothetical protein